MCTRVNCAKLLVEFVLWQEIRNVQVGQEAVQDTGIVEYTRKQAVISGKIVRTARIVHVLH